MLNTKGLYRNYKILWKIIKIQINKSIFELLKECLKLI
jgi:hypothetical protein